MLQLKGRPMLMRHTRTAFACLILLVSASASALGPEYSAPATIPSRAYINLGILPDGNFAVPALDASHITEVDCITGCSGSGGGGSGNQGTPNTAANAWPTYLVYGGSAVSSSNKFPITSALDALISAGALQVSQSGSWAVSISNFPSTQAVSAASLPLPSGASTSALQSTGNTTLASILSALGSPVQAGASLTISGNVGFTEGGTAISASNPVTVVVEPSTNAIGSVTVTSLPSVTLSGTPTVALAAGTTASISAPTQITASISQVPVGASSSTLIWTHSSSARTLRIVPLASNATCTINDTGAAASASAGYPIPATGVIYDLHLPPPTTGIYAFCTTAGTIAVSQGN